MLKRKQFVAVIATCTLLSGVLGAKSVTVTGRVVDSAANPVTGATVLFYEVHYAYAEGQIIWKQVLSKTTDEDGGFSIDLESHHDNDFMLIAYKSGLSLTWQRVRRRENISHRILRLSQPAELAGIVVDTEDEPLPLAKIRLCPAHGDDGSWGNLLPEPRDWLRATTQKDGRFSFGHLPQDATADLWVEAPGKAGYWTFWQRDSSVGSQFRANARDIRIVLQEEARIHGRVTDEASGQGVVGVTILARADRGVANYYTRYRAVSGDDGSFVLRGLPADDYSLQVVAPYEGESDWVGRDLKVSVAPGQIRSGVNIPVSHGEVLEVTVTDASSGSPVTNASVTVQQKANFGRHICFYKSKDINEQGKALFRVPAGTCEVSVWGIDYAYYPDESPVVVSAGANNKKTIEIESNPSAQGRIIDEQGNPVRNVVVVSKPICNQMARSDSQGLFKVRWYDPPQSRPRTMCLLVQDQTHHRAALAQIDDGLLSLQVQLSPAYTIRGQVSDPQGRGIPTASVRLRASMPGWSTDVGFAVTTDQQGDYEIRTLPKQVDYFKYRLAVSAKGYGPTEVKDVPVEGNPDDPISIPTVVLHPTDQSITGMVVDANDQPVPGVELFVRGPRGSRRAGQPSRKGVTDAQGRFVIEGLCAGPLRIQAGTGGRERKPGMLDAQGGDRDLKVVMGQ